MGFSPSDQDLRVFDVNTGALLRQVTPQNLAVPDQIVDIACTSQ